MAVQDCHAFSFTLQANYSRSLQPHPSFCQESYRSSRAFQYGVDTESFQRPMIPAADERESIGILGLCRAIVHILIILLS